MASVSQTAIASTTTDGSSATFSAQAIGANGGNDILYVIAGARTTANASTISVTIDGVAASQIVFRSSDEGGSVRANCGIYALARNSLPDPAQTDVDIVITHNATCIRHAAAIAVSADASATAHASEGAVAGDLDFSVNAPASGIVVAGLYNGDFTTVGWTGATEQSELNVAGEGSNTFGTAYASNVSAGTPRTVSVVFSGSDLAAKVVATFPAAGATITDTAGSSAGTGVATGDARASAATAASAAGVGAATAIAAVVAASIALGQGVGEATAASAVVASVAALAQASATATASSEDAVVEEPAAEEAQTVTANGGGAYVHPDLLRPAKKKRKPRVLNEGAAFDAENDFRTLWEAVKIRNDPRRLDAAMRKRAAILADLEKATLVRTKQ